MKIQICSEWTGDIEIFREILIDGEKFESLSSDRQTEILIAVIHTIYDDAKSSALKTLINYSKLPLIEVKKVFEL